MPHPLVSIGMPIYNGEEYVRDALDSLLAQTHNNFELIISDNGSTDKTEQICRWYAARDSRIRYVRQAVNRGAVANFQFVLDEASGQFFMWAAYDDLWGPHFISDALTVMEDQTIGFVFPTTILKSVHFGIYRKIRKSIFQFIETDDANKRVLCFANIHQSSHKCNLVYSLFRTRIIRDAYQVQDISSDLLLSMVALKKSKGKVLGNHCFYKRYPYLWPGFKKKILIKRTKRMRFEMERDQLMEKAKFLFPEIKESLEFIRANHRASRYHRGFQIVKNLCG